jgi:hypothetical protein
MSGPPAQLLPYLIPSGVIIAALIFLVWAVIKLARQGRPETLEEAFTKAAVIRGLEIRSVPASSIEIAAKEPAKTRIFISYRRAGDRYVAGRISDRLGNEFDVFMDVEGVRYGEDFWKIITDS